MSAYTRTPLITPKFEKMVAVELQSLGALCRQKEGIRWWSNPVVQWLGLYLYPWNKRERIGERLIVFKLSKYFGYPSSDFPSDRTRTQEHGMMRNFTDTKTLAQVVLVNLVRGGHQSRQVE